MKALILCAGSGTRLRPLTDNTNKHLLDVAGSPMITYPVAQAISLGLDELVFVYGNDGKSIPQVVEKYLIESKKRWIDTKFVLDKKGNYGIANSMICARDFIGDDRFMVFFGDVLYSNTQKHHVDKFNLTDENDAAFLLDKVQNPKRHASVVFRDNKIENIIEKCDNPKLNTIILSLDIYTNKVWDYVSSLKPSNRNELEITDLRCLMINNHQTTYSYVKGFWIDAGTIDSLNRANEYFSNNPIEYSR